MSSKSTSAAKALKRYRKNLREIDNYAWPHAVCEFGLYKLPFSSDYWMPLRGIPDNCGICKKKMTAEDYPQTLVECGHDFCGKCIQKWFSKDCKPYCPICNVYIDREEDPRFCPGCNNVGCRCDYNDYDDVCPVCHVVHENMEACVAEYYDEVNSSVYNPETGMLRTIEEEGDETVATATKKEEDMLKDACLVS